MNRIPYASYHEALLASQDFDPDTTLIESDSIRETDWLLIFNTETEKQNYQKFFKGEAND